MPYLNFQIDSVFQVHPIKSSLGSWVQDKGLGKGRVSKGEGAGQHVVDGQRRGEAESVVR